jgi:hypothetical protein
MVPTLVEALIDVPIKAIACGAGHMAAISGTPFNVRERPAKGLILITPV